MTRKKYNDNKHCQHYQAKTRKKCRVKTIKNKWSMRSQMMPSTGGGRVGCRWSQRRAFPRHKEIARRWKSWPVLVEGSSGLARLEMAFPIARTVEIVSSDRPPRFSTTMGTKSIPAARQSDRWAVSLRCTPTFRAWPGVDAAAQGVRSWRDLTLCAAKFTQFRYCVAQLRTRGVRTNPAFNLILFIIHCSLSSFAHVREAHQLVQQST